MTLEVRLESSDKNCSFEEAPLITVSVILRDLPRDKLKPVYQGQLSSRIAAEDYAAHLAYAVLGTSNQKNELYNSTDDYHRSLSRIATYDLYTKNLRATTFSTETIEDPVLLQICLEDLERKWYCAPRKEIVNDCDYWRGFFGTSNNLWADSTYPKGSCSEKARQLAYDVAQNIRTVEGRGSWYFPGPFDQFEKKTDPNAQDLIDDINAFLNQNGKMEAGRLAIIKKLTAFADNYDSLGR